MSAVFCVMGDPALDRALEESRYDSYERAEIERVFEDAARSGIGRDMLLPRVQEAKAKRVTAERLVAALRLEVERLERARDILIDTENGKALLFDDAGWQRTANLIAWGASQEEIQAIAAACVEDVKAYLAASYLFTSLIEWGLEKEISVQLTSAVAGSKIHPDEYPGVFEVLINGRRLKIQPRDIVERIILALDEVESVRQLQRKVLNVR